MILTKIGWYPDVIFLMKTVLLDQKLNRRV